MEMQGLNFYSLAAYLLLLYLCVIKKIGSNTNRRYEIYVEVFGRLLAVNGITLLYVWAMKTGKKYFLSDIMHVLFATVIESIIFAVIFWTYKREAKRIHGENICSISKAESMEQAMEKIRQKNTIFLEDIPSEQRNKLLKYCYEQGKQVYCTTKLSDVMIRGSRLTQYNDTPVLFCAKFGFGMGYKIVKRALDIAGALFFLIVLSPVFLIIACKIKMEDGGTVFYRQIRCTENLKEFQIYKFLSLIHI